MDAIFDVVGNPLLYYAWILLALVVFVVSLKVTAPYGRHVRKGWGPTVSNKLGWLIMELPALVTVPMLFYMSDTKEITHCLLVALWLVHYVHRTLIFPFMTKTKSKRIPVVIVLMAVVFNIFNGLIVGMLFYAPANSNLIIVLLGLVIFIVGVIINVSSDYHLINLRKVNGQQYVIPQGKWFKFVSCPNHLGEIIEWLGFSIIAMHIGPFIFWIWTTANLVPRSRAHHIWYKQHFVDYPKKRKAVLPYLF